MDTTNPLLAKLRIPGETFRLPSQGVFYTNGELSDDVKNGEVEVYPMTAQDEIILNTPDKLLSGKAILEIFSRCIPQVLKPHDLLGKDVDFLMVCLRMVTFGQTMDVTFQHNCENAREHTYAVDLLQMIREARSIDPTTVFQSATVTLDNGQVVKIKPMTYGQVLTLLQAASLNQQDQLTITEKEAEQMILAPLAALISSVDGVTDAAFIYEWLKKLPRKWKIEISNAAGKLNEWGVDVSSDQVCQDCKEQIRLTVSTNPVSFFM